MKAKLYIVVLISLAIGQISFAQSKTDRLLNATNQFLNKYVDNGLVDYEQIFKQKIDLENLVKFYEDFSLNDEDQHTLKAFWINAYNITTIKSVVDNYPISSPLKVSGFFNSAKHKVASKNLTLDEIQKKVLFPIDLDPKIHFAINCAAISCPELINRSYIPTKLETQLTERAKTVINDANHVKVNEKEKTVYLSEIFKWYEKDFSREADNIIEYLNKYRKKEIPNSYSVDYIKYNWKLNSASKELKIKKENNGVSLQNFTPSTLLTKGQYEIKLFNNLYTQTSFYNGDSEEIDQNSRSTFNTILTSFLYGISNSVNIGFDLWIRSVKNGETDETPLDIFDFKNSPTSRTAISSFGPKIKFDPFSSGLLEGFSIQSAFLIPLVSNLEGSSNQPFLDFDSYLWLNQFFYDKRITNDLSFFGEIDTWVRIDRDLNGKRNSLQLPIKAFLSYYPSDIITLYGMTEFSYKFGEGDVTSYYSQAGLGIKYQIISGIELEGLFTNFYIGNNSGAGSTYNLGIRIVQ